MVPKKTQNTFKTHKSVLLLVSEAESDAEREKRKQIEAAIGNDFTTLKTWKDLAKSKFGLVGDDLRYTVWPLLLGVDPSTDEKIPSLEELSAHPEYQQVVLDVNRSLKRFPPGIPYEQRVALQDQLTVLILRVIIEYPHLRYYQEQFPYLDGEANILPYRVMQNYF
ncbi:hypothetical protein HUJ04_005496 [Dendroctonus ponderosae]|nr:hypothetical protein HUJ04_005496 [Dendroctonus ponderosae]